MIRYRSRTCGSVVAASIAVALAVVGTIPVSAQDEIPPAGTFVLTVGADQASDDLPEGTYTLVSKGSSGYLEVEYPGAPGSICPFTATDAGGTLTFAFGGDAYPLCSRTTVVTYRSLPTGLQFLHQSTDPGSFEARDAALFGGTTWLGSAADASAAPPPSAVSAYVPTGSWEKVVTEDDFAGFVPPGADMSGAIGTYVLAFEPTQVTGTTVGGGTLSARQGDVEMGSCPFEVRARQDGAVDLVLGGQCTRTVAVAWSEAANQLAMTWRTSHPSDSAPFDQAVFGVKPWSRPAVSASGQPSPAPTSEG